MNERKVYVDSLYGSTAMARTKEDAWYLICEKCKDGDLPLPTIDQIFEEGECGITESENFYGVRSCPFCGTIPEEIKRENNKIYISCPNIDCPIGHVVIELREWNDRPYNV